MSALRLLPIVLGLVGGCTTQSSSSSSGGSDPGNSGDGWGTGTGGTGGAISDGCTSDAACGSGNVCARDGECLAASQVHVIHVTWTIKGQPAGDSSCSAYPNLDITFLTNRADGDQFGFAPVPCTEGKFTVDKMPTRYVEVELEPECLCKTGSSGLFDSTGSATLDLSF